MKHNTTRIVALLLLLLILVPAIAACADKDNSSGGNNVPSNVSNTSAEETTNPYDPELPARDYNNEPFVILTKSVATYNEWGETSIITEDTADVVNEAIYRRNLYIEETFNIVIEEYPSGSIVNDVNNSITSGDAAFDVVMPPFGDSGSLAANGSFVDLNTVQYINLSRAWWDQSSIDDLSIAGRQYFVASDISMLNNDATWCTMFNKEMVVNKNMANPYDLVANNEWTYENLYTLYSGLSEDLDGNQRYDSDDLYINLTQNENFNAMYIGGGERLIAKDADDYPVIAIGQSGRSVSVVEIINTIMNDPQFSYNYHTMASALGYHLQTTRMFEEGRGFMWITNLQIVIRLRDLDMEFGIVPVPKYSSEQEEYANVVWIVGSYVAIPKGPGDLERTGIILEAMAAKSLELLRPAYYDIALSSKYLRDEESVEMLDIVMAERVFDLGLAYNFGGIADIIPALGQANNNALMSRVDGKIRGIESSIEKTIQKFDEIEQ